MPSRELWAWDAGELARAIRLRQISAREAVRAALDRCAAVNPKINAVVRVLEAPDEYTPLRAAARRMVMEEFHLRDVILPRQIALIEALAAGKPGSDVIAPPRD